jgi:hypothetical protein
VNYLELQPLVLALALGLVFKSQNNKSRRLTLLKSNLPQEQVSWGANLFRFSGENSQSKQR